MNDYEYNEMLKKKNAFLKKIEENKRLMELIKNPHIKDSLVPVQIMKRNIAIKKIQVIQNLNIIRNIGESYIRKFKKEIIN